MPVYNGARFVEEAIASILEQTFKDFELIVIDDGSIDGTALILERMKRLDRRILVINQPRRGLTASLNNGIARTTARYVAREDADDMSLPDRLERQVHCLDESPEVAVVGSSADVISESGRRIGTLSVSGDRDCVRRDLLCGRTTLVHGSTLVRRRALELVGGYRGAFRLAQDLDLWLRILERFEIQNIPDVLYRWRLNSQGAYHLHRIEQLKFAGVARIFARERKKFGKDSYPALVESRGDLDAFAAAYHLKGNLYAIWGELLFRGLRRPAMARIHLRRALMNGFLRPRVLCLFGWALLGLSWPGSRPLSAGNA